MPLHGRDREREALAALLQDARESRSRVLVLRGAPGIGKSALVQDTIARANDMRVLRATGVESESDLAFAGVHQFLRPVLDLLDGIPQPQAAALRSAVGMTPAGGADPFLVGAGVLSVLALSAEERPLLCVVEDAHWLDPPSADALGFAARRLDAEAIAFLFVSRVVEASASRLTGLPELQLAGLDDDAAAAVLAEGAGAFVPPSVRERLIAVAGGNPLVLLELPRALTAEQLTGREPLADPLPLPARLEEAFRARIDALPEGSRLLLLAAAADNTGLPAIVLEAAGRLGVTQEDAEQAEASGLLRISGTVDFRHPLVRSAVYQSAPFGRRKQVHEAFVALLADERWADCRAWHLAAATAGPDDEVADELERSAERARARSGYATVATALARSASFTVDEEKRAARQLAAATAATQAGQSQLAAALLAEARRFARDPLLRADIQRLTAAIELERGSPTVAYELLLGAAAAVVELDPSRAASILLEAASAARYGGDLRAQIEVGHRADELRRTLGPNFELTVSAGLGKLWEGDPEGRALLEQATAEAGTGEHPRRYLWSAVSALHLGDETTARIHAARDAALARGEGAVPSLAVALSRLAFAEIAEGRLISARANASEGLALAEQTGMDNIACYHHALLAWTAALLGEPEEARTEAEAAFALSRGQERAWQASVAMLALGDLELALGRPDDAVTHFETLSAAGSQAHPYLSVRAAPSLVEAAMRIRRLDVAKSALARLESWADATRSRSQLALVERSRALVAPERDERRHFEAALGHHADVPRPFEHARTALLFGESLRRAGSRREARDHLRAALELFRQVGAQLWADQAEAALRATGARLRPRGPSAQLQLTPQELQVARFVATGATNKEVAAQLFLSPRTVDAHLRTIFAKLGITSRRQLADFA